MHFVCKLALFPKAGWALVAIMRVVTAYAYLRYEDADETLRFLRAAFGFEAEALHRGATARIEHALVRAGSSLIMVGEQRGPGPYSDARSWWTYVAVGDVDELCARRGRGDHDGADRPAARIAGLLGAGPRRQPVELRDLPAMSGRVDAAGGARWAKRLPGVALSEWVAVIWYSADNRGGRTRERLLPRGTVELVTELGPENTSIIGPDRRIDVDPVSVVGASPQPFVLDRPNRFATIGVTFRPGGAVALLGVSADELDGAPLPLGLLWGAAAAELRERATAATGPGEKLAAVEHVLAEQLPHVERARRYDPAIAAMSRIAAAPERCSIADVSASVGVSRRRLEETFRVAVGLTPKRFQRLWRFRRALERIDHHQDQGWAAFALERGYYDQAHFSNEFPSPHRPRARGLPRGSNTGAEPCAHRHCDLNGEPRQTDGDQAHPSLRRDR